MLLKSICKHSERKLYVSAFLDLYDRTLVGYEIGDHNDNSISNLKVLIRQ